MKKVKFTVFIALALIFAAANVYGFNADSGDASQGEVAFKEKCRKCHNGDKAGDLSPSYKTKKQWTRYFNDDYAKLKWKMPDWDSYGYSDADLENIHRYLLEHALDSAHPKTCE